MPSNHYDIIIIGQGLAGTTLAWVLRRRGLRVLVIDREEPITSSRIAAGLITPITGLRFVKTLRFDEFRPAAESFYRAIEADTGSRFFIESRMVRLFRDSTERELFEKKAATRYSENIDTPERLVDESIFNATSGGFEMFPAARLNVSDYLDVSRKAFTENDSYIAATIDPRSDLRVQSSSISFPGLNVSAKRVIFCQGFQGSENPWFRSVPFDAVKGEILTVRIPGLQEQRVIHRGVWLAPKEGDLYRFGATHDREQMDNVPTPQGREDLCARLEQLMHLPYEVVDHQAAVRPVILGRRPMLGFHPAFPQLGYFNGLGSKGSLQAPWLAEHFADVITEKTPLLPELDVSQFADLSQCFV